MKAVPQVPLSPLYHVFRSYWTRRLNLLLLGIASLLGIGLLTQLGPSPGRSIVPMVSHPAPHLSASGEQKIDNFWSGPVSQVRTLIITDHPVGTYPDLRQFPETRTLVVGGNNLNAETAEQIVQLPHLQGLDLSSRSIPPGLLKRLGGQLQQLQMSADLLTAHAAELPALTQLTQLNIKFGELTPAGLQAIAALPRLKILVLEPLHYVQPLPDQPDVVQVGMLTIPALEPLRNHPTLRNVYIADDATPAAERNVDALRPIRILPTAMPVNQTTAMMLGQLLLGVVSLLIGLQLWEQFQLPSAALMPTLPQWHRRAAWLLLLIYGGSVGSVMVLTGTAVLPAAVSVGLIPATAAVAVLLWNYSPGSSGLQMAILMGGFVVLSGGWMQLWMFEPWSAGVMIDFLRGGFPLTSAGMLLLEGFLIQFAFRQLPHLNRQLNERFATIPRTSFWNSQQQLIQAVKASEHKQTNSTLRWRMLDRAALKWRYQAAFWNYVFLWRTGNPYRAQFFVAVFTGLFATCFFLLPWAAEKLALSWAGSASAGLLNSFGVQIILMPLLMPLAIWHARCEQLRLEFMRPVSRPRLIQQLFASLLRDQAVALLPALLVLGVFALRLSPFPEQPLLSLLHFAWPWSIATLAAFLWIFALSTLVFALKQVWIKGAAIVCLALLPVIMIPVVGYYIAQFDIRDIATPQGSRLLLIAALASLPFSLGLLTLSYRATLAREWG